MRAFILLVLLFRVCGSADNPCIDPYFYQGELEQASSIPGIDCIYLINLDKRPDRLAVMEDMCDRYGVEFVRLPAINGWKLFQGRRAGHAGATLSHLSVCKDASVKNYQVIWVLEDDVKIVGDVKKLTQYISQIDQLRPDWDILFTGRDTYTDDMTRTRYNRLVFFHHDFAKVIRRHGAFSMILSKRGIKKILQYYSNQEQFYCPMALGSRPIDVAPYLISHCQVYTIKENLVLHRWEDKKSSDTDYKLRRKK